MTDEVPLVNSTCSAERFLHKDRPHSQMPAHFDAAIHADAIFPMCILENIFSFLSGNTLRKCKSICKLWLVSAENAFRRREYTVSIQCEKTTQINQRLIDNDGLHESQQQLLQVLLGALESKINETPIDVCGVMLFCTFPIKISFGLIGLTTYQNIGKHANNGSIIGCNGSFVFNANGLEGVSGSIYNLSLNKPCSALQCLLLPNLSTYQISQFYIPLRKKYESISGISSFLPNVPNNNGKIIVLFANPLRLGKLTNFVKAARSKYSTDICIIGSYADDFIFLDNLATYGEIVGWVFTGLVKASSVVISWKSTVWEIYDIIKSFAENTMVKEKAEDYKKSHFNFLLIFSTHATDARLGCILMNLRRSFSGVTISGLSTEAAFGGFHNMHMGSCDVTGCRDYLQTSSIVICYISIAKSSLG